MLEVHERHGRSCVALTEVTPEEISSYGCVDPDPSAQHDDGLVEIRRIVEKPARDEAPSNLAVIGRYVFTPEIFDMLDRIEPGRGGELQLTDAMALLLERQSMFGYVCRQGRYDVGQKLDFLRANVELALERPDLGPALGEFLGELIRRRGLS
jgi:UTP--glucose-1-phosphate uridylyltransferase